MNRLFPLAAASASLLAVLSAGPAAATPPFLAEAKKQGLPAQNCQYCHTVATPKKETFKPEELNDRGKWLSAEKEKQKATNVKVEWLKEYPGGKEQKK